MANNRLKESMKSLWINPEKDEQQKWMKIGNTFSPKHQQQQQPLPSLQYNWRLWDPISIERSQALRYPGRGSLLFTQHQRRSQIEKKVRRILKLIKSINQGNKEANQKKKSELIQLVEDFHKQYQSLYALYDDIKEGVRNKVTDSDEKSSSSSSSSSVSEDSDFSPGNLSSKNSGTSRSDPFSQKVVKSDSLNNSEPEGSYLDEANEVVKEALNVEPVSSSSMVHNNMMENLTEESSLLKERLAEREKEIFSLTTENQVLEGQADVLKIELEKLRAREVEYETEIGRKGEENIGLKALVSEMEAREDEYTDEMNKFKKNEKESMAKIDEAMKKAENLQVEVVSLRAQKHDLGEQMLAVNKKGLAQVKSLTDEINSLQQELKLLSTQKNKKEGELEKKSREMSEYVKQIENLKQGREALNLLVKDLEMKLEKKSRETSEYVKQLENLKEGREALNLRVKDLEMELEKKSREMSEYVMQIENLKELLERKDVDERDAKNSLNLRVKYLEVETSSLTSAKSDLEEKLKIMYGEANQSKVEKDELYAKIFDLEGKVREKENGVFLLQKKVEVYENETKSFKQKLDNLQSEKRLTQFQIEKEREEHSHSITRLHERNNELTNKVTEKNKILEQKEDVMKKLSQEHKQVQGNFLDSKLSLKTAERKMDEMAEEFRKKFEDNIRLLSRRIRVAEQLHAECKDWYKNTQEQFEQDQRTKREALEKIKDLTRISLTKREALEKIKDLTIISNEILVKLDTMGLKFSECCEHFMNRISKVSCELHFVKDFVGRKNKAIKLVKVDFVSVLSQLDSKEEEILGLRQKVWKLENKAREFEKVAKENKEGMLVLKEEKREAIRQLCVWIDYHRGRCDYLKKTLTEVTSRNQARTYGLGRM